MGHSGSTHSVPPASPFHLQATDLEEAISQAADDLKITAFGQRVRATLRRNRQAASSAILPHASYKDVAGPDLVRELNALYLLVAAEDSNLPAPSRLDRELVDLLNDHIDIARGLVAFLWDDALHDCASLFIDYDNVPIPLCPMYCNARELIGTTDAALPRPLVQIIERLKTELAQSPLVQASLDHADDMTSAQIQCFQATKRRFTEESPYRQGETVADWGDRLQDLIQDGRSAVPPALLALNQLIHLTVMCLVSLAVWDNRACPDDISSCQPAGGGDWGAPIDSSTDEPGPGHARPGRQAIPDGYELTVSSVDLMLLPLDAAIRLYDDARLRSIAVAKGASISWERDNDIDARLIVTPFATYETTLPGSR